MAARGVLVVDPDEDTRCILRVLLTHDGYRALEAAAAAARKPSARARPAGVYDVVTGLPAVGHGRRLAAVPNSLRDDMQDAARRVHGR